MNIMYDYQILTMQKYGGISRYFYELATGMERLGNKVAVPCIYSRNEYFKNYFIKTKLNPDSMLPYGKGGGYINKIYSRIKHNELYDIIHPTYYDTYILGKHTGKLVTTVHDMIYEKWPLQDKNTVRNKKEHIYKSDKILTVSEHSKKDILDVYPDIDENKIIVTYLGCDLKMEDATPSFSLPPKYVLYIGNRERYKNFENFLKSMNIVIKQIGELKIVCGGGGSFNDYETTLIRKLKLEDKIFQFNYTEEETYHLYKNAECFVFPSLYEGFGIPLLESMTAGCPLLCSNASCFPEIAAEAAIYFDGREPEDIAEKVCSVVQNENLKNDLINKGYERAKHFSWEETVRKTLMAYEQCLQ